MNRSICWLTLDMNRRDGQCSVSLGQGETGRTLKFRLYENGAPYTIPEGHCVIISGVMDNNHDGVNEYVIYNDCYIQDGVVCYDITDATALGTVGVMNCQLQIVNVDNGCVFVCSPKFQIVVHSAVYDKKTVESSEQFFALQKILEGLSQGGGSSGGSSGGGMEIVTVSGTTPSMSSQEIYEKYQNGVVICLEYALPNGNTVLFDLSNSTESQATFLHTQVDEADNNTKTYKGLIFGSYFMFSAIPQELPESVGGGGSLPLSGKTVILFGEDIQYYDATLGEYIASLTGASIINAGINGTTMSTCHSSSEQNAFSGYSLIRAYTMNDYTEQETALSSSSFPSGINKSRCQDVVNALKASPRDEIAVFVCFGKNDLIAGAVLKNESSKYDSSTFYGAFGVYGSYALMRYSDLTFCSPIWSYYNDPLSTPTQQPFEEKANAKGATGSDIVEVIREVANNYNAKYVDFLNIGWSLNTPYVFGSTIGFYNWAYMTSNSQGVMNVARIIARELI